MKKIILMLLVIAGLGYAAKAQDSVKVKKAPEDHATKESRVLQKKLNLTDDQTKQIAAIMADRDSKIAEYKGLPDGRQQTEQARTDANNQIEVLLTADQKKQFDQMIVNQKTKTNSTKFLIPATKKGF